ncbi:MAG: DUF6544 family protein [Candidatus Sulfotelmatobacter sp.]
MALPEQHERIQAATVPAQALLARLRAFCFPGGEDAARGVLSVCTTQIGEMRMSPGARWIPFISEETIDATRSSFRWEARLDPGKLGRPTVIDAYEEGHGRLVVKLGGVLPVKKITGPQADRGELQRYLASLVFCPPMLVNHPSLDWAAVGPHTLRLRERDDPTGATVDLEINEQGRPLVCRADRPRISRKEAVLTPWSGTCTEFREWEGLRIPSRLEVAWHLPEEAFTYFRAEITSFAALRRDCALAL